MQIILNIYRKLSIQQIQFEVLTGNYLLSPVASINERYVSFWAVITWATHGLGFRPTFHVSGIPIKMETVTTCFHSLQNKCNQI